MEFHEEPAGKEEEYSFMQETIKDKNGGHGKSRDRILKCAGLGLIFGLAACLGFYALKPWAESVFLGGPEKITISEEEEETKKDAEEEAREEELPALTLEDYKELHRALVSVADTADRSMAEIVSTASRSAWKDAEGQGGTRIAGAIFEDNGSELLIVGKSISLEEGEKLQARLADGKSYPASVKKRDENLGIAVFAVEKSRVPDTSWKTVQALPLGSSATVAQGDMVIALGSPFGYYGGMGIGAVASTENVTDRADGQYGILQTDIAAPETGSGILLDTDGRLVGIIGQQNAGEEGQNLITAYGISDIKKALEFLSNEQAVPYMGIRGITVTEEIADSQGIPRGVYVQEVEKDSPAMAAGVQSGDVITEVDGQEITAMTSYTSVLMKLQAGQEIRVEVQRQGTGGYVDIPCKATVGSRE